MSLIPLLLIIIFELNKNAIIISIILNAESNIKNGSD